MKSIKASRVVRDAVQNLQPKVTDGSLMMADPFAAIEHFKAIVQSSDDAIISKTLQGIITSWNQAAERIFGYSAAEMIGQSMLKLFPSHLQDEEAQILQRIVQGEKIEHFETQRLRKDGQTIQVEVTISPVRDALGRIVGASKIARDVTERKALQERLQLISSVFTHTTEAVVITDAWGHFLEVNESFTRLTGYSREAALGQDLTIFKSSRQGPEVYQRLWTELQATGHCQGEVWSRRQTGEAFAGLLTVSCMYDKSGQPNKYVAIFADITPLRVHQERLEQIVNFDPLTSLPNRLLLSDRLHQALANAKRHQQAMAVVYLDLDGFKAINDQYGHDVGDSLLIALSEQLQTAIRQGDTLARMGGDEFVVVLSEVDPQQGCDAVLERLLQACNTAVDVQGLCLQVSGSLGVTVYPQDDSDAEQLMRHADQAMYDAKQAGKNRIHQFDLAKDAQARSRAETIASVSRGVERHEFVLHFQPKVNMRTGHLVGAEALLRWQHPERGLLSPAEFLPLIEDHALIETLGEQVLEAALTQMDQWQSQGLTIPVSINVSARQFKAPDFCSKLATRLAAHPHIAPHLLELELVESSALDHVDDVARTMRRCIESGLHFAIDDFGTGYSTLTYLKRLPVATLKIDQSFVRTMLDDAEDMAIVKGVIGLASAFNRQVIAEGVETVAHGAMLLSLGCEQAQGYGIARPMPGNELAAWAGNWQSPCQWREAA